MIKDILVCLEGSQSSERAAELAVELARGLPATLTGLAIVDEPDILAGQATGIGGASFKHQRDEALLADAQECAQKWLDSLVARGRAAEVQVRPLQLRGRPAATIVEELQRHDLTLLGREANFRFETVDRDRKTRDTILRHAGKPLIVVPENPLETHPSAVVAYDGSAAAKRALHSFGVDGLARGRTVQVVSIDDDGSIAWEKAVQGCVLLSELGVPARPQKVVSLRSVAEALLEQCDHLKAGMLVLGAYVPSRLSRALWGSVTQEIVEKTRVPLYLHY